MYMILFIYTYICVYTYLYTHVHLYTNKIIYTYTYMYIYVYIYIYIYMLVGVCVYTCIFVFKKNQMYIYKNLFGHRWKARYNKGHVIKQCRVLLPCCIPLHYLDCPIQWACGSFALKRSAAVRPWMIDFESWPSRFWFPLKWPFWVSFFRQRTVPPGRGKNCEKATAGNFRGLGTHDSLKPPGHTRLLKKDVTLIVSFNQLQPISFEVTFFEARSKN